MRSSRSSRRGQQSRRNPFQSRLRLELLEDRHLLSGTRPSLIPAGALVPDSSSTDYDPASIMVRFRTDGANSGNTVQALAGTTLGPALADLLEPGLYEIRLEAGMDVPTALAAYRADPNVLTAEPNFHIYTSYTVPNDQRWSSMWNMRKIEASDASQPDAWDYWTGGGGLIVADIDTGIDYNHPDLVDNLWTNPADGSHGRNFLTGTNNPLDDNGHGSHTAGTIGAEGNNGVGVVGVNWYTQLMALKVFNAQGAGSLTTAITALNYAVANGALVSNNSYGCSGCYTAAFVTALQNAAGYGHIFVAAAGNSGRSTPDYPAAYDAYVDNVIAVAATTSTDGLASYSNYSSSLVHLGAPGSSVVSTYRNGGYATLSGTSMASPHVAGAVALVYDYYNNVYGGADYHDIINQIVYTVDPVPALQGRTISGGRLNVARAIGAVSAPGGPNSGHGFAPRLHVVNAPVSPAAATIVSVLVPTANADIPVATDSSTALTPPLDVAGRIDAVFAGTRSEAQPVFAVSHQEQHALAQEVGDNTMTDHWATDDFTLA